MAILVGAAVLSATATAPLAGELDDNDAWVLKFEDDFQRAELGREWSSNDAVIRDGRMLLGLKQPACAKINRPFPADVRIELTAEAYEDRPPCDLSVTLAAERFRQMSFNYLLAFGGVHNTVNKLTGGRNLKGTYDEDPKRLVVPGRKYRIVATKEGRRLSLVVDGELLLEGTDEQIMGGPGFDAVGLVTWNGMVVDDVRVYERRIPHPDTPRYLSQLQGLVLRLNEAGQLAGPDDLPARTKAAVAAYNRRDLAAAEKAFMAADGEIKAAGLAYVYGNLNHDERPEDFPRVARLFRELAEADPADRRLADYARTAAQFGRVRIFPRSAAECSFIMALGPGNNPFFDKAKLYRARFLRANGQEAGNRQVLATAMDMLKELQAKAPTNVVLRELTGEQIPWGKDLIDSNPDTPRWAGLLREMYARQLAIMNWWFTERQMPDGQLGGGWGDDVELLRSWGPFAMISDADPTVRDGIARLCEGVWDHVLVEGYSAEPGDVEHSSEPSADTLPQMLALRYGDPLWHRRNLASCRRIRDCYTGIDRNGYVRFKSGYFGGDRASDKPRHGGDTHYSPRPMKHFLWAAWYGDQQAKDFYLNWAKGWVEATMTPKYTKPAGMPPATIWYPSGDVAPPDGSPWNDSVYNLYGSGRIGNPRLHDAFLAGYYFSGDPLYLRPMHIWMRYYQTEIPNAAASPPTIDKDPVAWAVRNARETWNCDDTMVQYRWLTGDAAYDELMGQARTAQRLHLPNDYDGLLRRLESALARLRVNFNLATREVLQTDRADLPGTEAALAAFTGAVRCWADAGVPTMAVTWDVPHPDFAALVVHTSPEHLRVWIYNFAPRTTRMGMHLWQLRPGRYEVNHGVLGKGNGYLRNCQWEPPGRFTVRHRAEEHWIDVPPRKELAVDFRLIEPIDRKPLLPDPAIAPRDLILGKDADGKPVLSVTVHNLGNEPVADLSVSLLGDGPGGRRHLAEQTINLLPACKDLQPATATVSFPAIDPAIHPAANLSVVLDAEDKVTEIYELNNEARLSP